MSLDTKNLLTVIILGLLISCSPKQSTLSHCVEEPFIAWDTVNNASSDKDVEALTIHIHAEPVSLHPINSSTLLRAVFNQYLHRTLVTYDNVHQQLSTDLLAQLPQQQANSKLYTYCLKENLFWDDGSPVTAADIFFTFLVNTCPLVENVHAKTYLEALEDIVLDKFDTKKCVFVMKNASLRNSGFATGFPILQAKKWDPNGVFHRFTFKEFKSATFRSEDYPDLVSWANAFNDVSIGRDPQLIVGLGKYAISNWVEGDYIELKRKQKYQEGANRIIFKVVKDPMAVQLSFSKQEIDASFLLTQEEFTQLSNNRVVNQSYRFACIDNRLYYFLAMNMRPLESGRFPFFADKRVREALALATPVDTMMQLLGCTQRMLGPVYSDNPEYNRSISPLQYDKNKAQGLLAEAGWVDTDNDGILDKDKHPFSFVLLCSNSTNKYKDMALLLSEFYRKIGVEMRIEMRSLANLNQQGKAHQFDMLLTGMSEDFLPQDFSELWHTQSWLNGGQNYSGFGNDTTNRLIDSIAEQSDINARVPLVHQLQYHIQQQYPVIFLFKTKMYIAVKKHFSNVKIYNHRPYVYVDTWRLRLAS